MLCTLYNNHNEYIKISPSTCHSSIFQLIASKYYYEVAKMVLTSPVTRADTDNIMTMRLAKDIN